MSGIYSSMSKCKEMPRPPDCLNCGIAVPPESIFCGRCGQENEPSPVSFAALVREAWDEFMKIDGKLLSTLWLLLSRPGYLSGEYVRGRRVAYLSPFKMYVTVSALFFLIWGLLVPFDHLNDLDRAITSDPAPAVTPVVSSTGAAMVAGGAGATGLPVHAPAANPKAPRIDVSLDTGSSGGDTARPRQLRQAWQEARSRPWQVFGRQFKWDSLPQSPREYRAIESAKSASKRDTPLIHYLTERLLRFRGDPAGSAKTLFSTGLPLLLLIQLPLFAIWMRVIYFRQRRLYVEHLIFLLHTHTFFFLLLGSLFAADAAARSLGTRIPILGLTPTWWLVAGAVLAYNVAAYRRFYGQDWGKTLVKGWFLLNGYLLLLGFTAGVAAVFATLWAVLAQS